MATEIKCPSCGSHFALGEAEAEEYKKELQQKMTAYVRQKDEEFKRKTEDLQKERASIESAAVKKAMDEMAMQLRAMEEETRLKTQQLQDMQRKELEFLRERN